MNLVIWNESTTLGQLLFTHPYPIFYWTILIGLAVGTFLGLPRWTYTYLGWGVISGLWFTHVYFNDQPMTFMVIPLVLAIAIPLLLRWWRRAQMRPKKLVQVTPRRDPNLLSLGIYIFFSAIFMIWDENHHPALLWFIAASGLGASLGAWGFFRAVSPFRQALSLAGGLAFVVALIIWNTLTWDAGAYYGLTDYSPGDDILTILLLFTAAAILMLGIGALTEMKAREGMKN